MRKLFLFMVTSVDGYFEGENHDISWHNVDEEFNTFAREQLTQIDTLLFGKTTYELMANYWPTEEGRHDDPLVAGLMNRTNKIVFSHTVEKITWENTTLIKQDLAGEIKKLKEKPGKDIAIFGSNNVAVQILELGLLDELRIMINPVVLGTGTLLFTGIQQKINLKLLSTKTFKNGNFLLYYQPTSEN